jgi:hypothetical protein
MANPHTTIITIIIIVTIAIIKSRFLIHVITINKWCYINDIIIIVTIITTEYARIWSRSVDTSCTSGASYIWYVTFIIPYPTTLNHLHFI